MLKLNETFAGTPILSLRIGGPVASVVAPIINPNNLFIEGWYAQDNRSGERLILLTKDVRDIISRGIAIDDYEVLSHEDDLVRLEEIIKINFQLTGLKVTSQNGQNYGKVSDFAFETSSFFVKKIYVAQPVFKNFAGGTLSIDRTQIIEITNKRIIIDDPTVKEDNLARATA